MEAPTKPKPKLKSKKITKINKKKTGVASKSKAKATGKSQAQSQNSTQIVNIKFGDTKPSKKKKSKSKPKPSAPKQEDPKQQFARVIYAPQPVLNDTPQHLINHLNKPIHSSGGNLQNNLSRETIKQQEGIITQSIKEIEQLKQSLSSLKIDLENIKKEKKAEVNKQEKIIIDDEIQILQETQKTIEEEIKEKLGVVRQAIQKDKETTEKLIVATNEPFQEKQFLLKNEADELDDDLTTQQRADALIKKRNKETDKRVKEIVDDYEYDSDDFSDKEDIDLDTLTTDIKAFGRELSNPYQTQNPINKAEIVKRGRGRPVGSTKDMIQLVRNRNEYDKKVAPNQPTTATLRQVKIDEPHYANILPAKVFEPLTEKERDEKINEPLEKNKNFIREMKRQGLEIVSSSSKDGISLQPKPIIQKSKSFNTPIGSYFNKKIVKVDAVDDEGLGTTEGNDEVLGNEPTSKMVFAP
tara:strand:- start:690 stop:2093 length:1404 start_codon:yes stop_codon:yes gene_type:complete